MRGRRIGGGGVIDSVRRRAAREPGASAPSAASAILGHRGCIIWMTGLSGLGKVDARPGAGAAPPQLRHPLRDPRRRRPAHRPQPEPRVHRRTTAARTCGGRPSSRSTSRTPASWSSRRSSRRSAPTARMAAERAQGARRPLRRGLRQRPARRMRAARPEAALQEGARRPDHAVHRHRLPLRGAAGARPRDPDRPRVRRATRSRSWPQLALGARPARRSTDWSAGADI